MKWLSFNYIGLASHDKKTSPWEIIGVGEIRCDISVRDAWGQ